MVVAAVGCDDELDVDIPDALDESVVFQEPADVTPAISGLYITYQPNAVIRFSSIFTDDTKIGADNGGQEVTFHRWVLNSAVGQANNIWANRYDVINTANRIIEGIDGLPEITSADDQVLVDRARGESLALRAFAHFELLQLYSENYDAGTLAVPYVRGVNVLEQPARNTVGEVFAAIKEDLTAAEALISADITDNGRITQDFFVALRARMALYEGDNATAISLADQLIARYPLATIAQYPAVFADTDETEVIFKMNRVQGDFRAGGVWFFTGTGGAFMEMSNSLFNELEPSDVRTNVIFDAELSDPSSNLHLIGKYLGSQGFDYLNDFKMFRASEMHLIRAEALARSNNLTGAADVINNLRTVRGSQKEAAFYSNLNSALTDILLERRIELAFEGHRYLDIKRMRADLGIGISRIDGSDCGGGTPCELATDDFRFTLPIPAAELDANPNIAPQNPGY